MEKLIEELDAKIKLLKKNQGEKYNLEHSFLDTLYSVYPFNKFEYIISHLIGTETISIQEYLSIRSKYLERNKFLYVFEITAPRTFGETWAQRHLNEIVPELKLPSTVYDPTYNGEYDFWYDSIKIEVKASRAVRRKSGGTLIEKALASDSSDEVKNNKYYSHGQHRGNIGEGQLWLKNTNIAEFTEYEVDVRHILEKIIEKGTL